MLHVALFGAGRIGRVHARSIVESGEAVLSWVCDPDATAGSSLAHLYGASYSPEPQDALEDASVDAVLVAAPTPTHTDLIRRSVLAGKKVFCEKPIDLDLAKIDACWADIADRAPFVMIGFNRRFDPSFLDVRTRVAAGEIGALRAIRISSRDPMPPPLSYLAVSGGMFKDMTIHDFDMARFQAGEIVEVSARASTNGLVMFENAGDHAQCIVTMRAESGVLVVIMNSRSCAFGYDQRLEAFGDGGSLEVGNVRETTVRASNARETEAAGRVVGFFVERYMPAYRAELAEFVAAIREDREPSVGFADGRAALVLAEAASESVATGRVVRSP